MALFAKLGYHTQKETLIINTETEALQFVCIFFSGSSPKWPKLVIINLREKKRNTDETQQAHHHRRSFAAFCILQLLDFCHRYIQKRREGHKRQHVLRGHQVPCQGSILHIFQ